MRHVHMFCQVLQERRTAWKLCGFAYRILSQAREAVLEKTLKRQMTKTTIASKGQARDDDVTSNQMTDKREQAKPVSDLITYVSRSCKKTGNIIKATSQKITFVPPF